MPASLSAPSTRSLRISDLVEELVGHPIYALIRDDVTLRLFMASHVFCVWDFQSLLKALQRRLTCVEVPWLPSSDPDARRLINEIVLDEESDAMPDGTYLSHFELYLRAMQSCGADTGPISQLMQLLQAGVPVGKALDQAELPPGVGTFVRATLEFAQSTDVHRIAAAFTYGREDVIPLMFEQLVRGLAKHHAAKWEPFLLYLNRHIEHDGDRHGPMSRDLVARLCGQDDRLWLEAEQAAREALQARLDLWNHVAVALEKTA